MYSTKPFNRGYTVYKENNDFSSLESVLVELAKAHLSLVKQDRAEYESMRDEYKHYLVSQAETLHNTTSEDSLESQDSAGIEQQLEARFPAWQGLGKAGLEAEMLLMEGFARDYGIINKSTWFFPQMLAKIAADVAPVLNEDGTHYSTKELYKSMRSTPLLYAILKIATFSKRSTFMKSQTSLELRNYSSLVPLIFAAFKQYSSIPYSKWDRECLENVVDINLYKAMSLTELPEITAEEVLADRNFALTVKTGVKAGQLRPAETTYTLYFDRGSPLYELPTLAKIMMSQTWCAHPINRSKMMILNPLYWDSIPEPLVNTRVIVPEPKERAFKFTRAASYDDMPWDV